MTGIDILNNVPEEARKIATAYLKGLERGVALQRENEEREKATKSEGDVQ